MLKSPLEKISEREAAIGNNKQVQQVFLLGWIGPGPDWSGLLCLAGLVCAGTRAGTGSGLEGRGGGYWDRERSGLMAQIYDGRDDLID